MAKEECLFIETPPLLGKESFSEITLNPDLSISFIYGENGAIQQMAPQVLRLRPTEILPNGVPVYDWSKLEKAADLHLPDFNGGDGTKPVNRCRLNGLYETPDAWYTIAAPGTAVPMRLPAIDGDGWWGSRNWRKTPLRFDAKTGKPCWLKLGRRAPARAKPGEMYNPNCIAGVADGVLFVTDVLNQVWAWTEDGLFLGPLLGTDTKFWDDRTSHVELTGSYVHKVDGKIYALTGDHGVWVHEVHLPTLTRLDGGTISLTAEQAAAVVPWDPDGPMPGKGRVWIVRSIWDWEKTDAAHVRTITLDGKLDPAEWSNIPAESIFLDEQKVAEVRATFDPDYLYLAFDVADPIGLKNSGAELPFTPFSNGAYLDISLGAEWKEPQRSKGADGDVRILFGMANGKPFQIAYWPLRREKEFLSYTLPGQKKTVAVKLNPQTIESPAAQRSFDDISPLPGFEFQHRPRVGGYTVEARVPWGAVGGLRQLAASAYRIGFDASVAFANQGATARARAAHWNGQSEAEVVDRPGSAELKPWTWGTLVLERAPVREGSVAADALKAFDRDVPDDGGDEVAGPKDLD
jgi:hypothetical protein